MEKIKPNYNFFLLIAICTSLMLMLISYLIDTFNLLQLIVLTIAPFFITFIFKKKYDKSPYGYFITANKIIYKDKGNEISTHLNDIKLKKRFFISTLILNEEKSIELCFYNIKIIEKYLNLEKYVT